MVATISAKLNTLSTTAASTTSTKPHKPQPLNARCLLVAKLALKSLAAFLTGVAIGNFIVGSIVSGGVTFGVALLALGIGVAINQIAQSRQRQAFCQQLIARTHACIQHDTQFKNKGEIFKVLEGLQANAHYGEVGNDDLRIKFVAAQGAIEHVLACSQAMQEIQGLVGAIHTPFPATPLCTRVKGDCASLLDASIAHDQEKLLTVKSRAEIIREYLKNGKLYVIYPKGGLEKRAPAEQAIYKEEVKKYPDKLIDTVLDCKEMNTDMIGATYLFNDNNKNLYSFSIKSRQANDIQKQADWQIWLGPITNKGVAARVNAVFDHIKSNGGPDIRT